MSQQERLVILMGPTGTGKSTFVNCATGRGSIHHGLRPLPPDIHITSYTHPTFGSFVFMDTPGFNGPSMTDVDILKMITSHLKQTYKENAKSATIIYLHKIDDNRMTAAVLDALNTLASLCAGKRSPNVIIATTMWSNVSEEDGKQREQELNKEFLPKVDGTRSVRFERTYQSAWDIIGGVTEKDQAEGLLITEIIDQGRLLTQRSNEHHEPLKQKLKGIFSRFIKG